MIIAELLGNSEDERKNIVIWIAFSKDGIEIPFYKGAELLIYNGRKAWPLYATYANFLGKTSAQRLQWIRTNVEHQIGVIIREIVVKAQIVTSVQSDLAPYIGQTIQKDSVTFAVDLNNDGTDEATITLKDDGTYTVS